MFMYLEPIRPDGLTDDQWIADLDQYRVREHRLNIGMLIFLVIGCPIIGFAGAYLDWWLH